LKGKIHPLTLQPLAQIGLLTEGLRSKWWNEFAMPDASAMDFVFTVCDQAAVEQCPVWPGQPITAHWDVPDPAAVEGSEDPKRRALKDAAATLQTRNDYTRACHLHRSAGLPSRKK